MENGPQSDNPNQFVIRSSVRSGHKRELAFALQSQANLSSSSLSRTRSGKPLSSSPPPSKRLKKKLQYSVIKADIIDDSIKEKEEEKAVTDDSRSFVQQKDVIESSNVLHEENGVLEKHQLLENHEQSSLSGLNARDEKLNGETVKNESDSPSKKVNSSLLEAEDTSDADIIDDSIKEKEEEKAVTNDSRSFVQQKDVIESSNVLHEENGMLEKQQLLENDKQSSLSGLNARDEKLNGETVKNEADSPSKKVNSSLLEAEDTSNAIATIIGQQLDHSDLVDVKTEVKEMKKGLPENSTILVQPLEILEGYNESHEESGVSGKQHPLINYKPLSLEKQNSDAKTGEVKRKKVSLPSRRFTRTLLKAEDVSYTTTTTTTTISIVGESVGFEDPSSKKMELKMSKKIGLNKLPSNVHDLLSTGLFEGLPVKYDTLVGKRSQLDGVIKGDDILCFCPSCKGCKVVSVFQFEMHAGSTKKCPSDYIFLQNGKSIRDILTACTASPLDLLTSVIQNAIGEVPLNKQSTCQKCKELFHTPHTGKFALMCDSCHEQGNKQTSQVTPAIKLPKKSLGDSVKEIPLRKKIQQTRAAEEDGSDSTSEKVSSQKLVGKLTKKLHKNLGDSVKRTSRKKIQQRRFVEEDGSDSTSEKISFQKSVGKLTKKDVSLHKLVFMDDILPEGTEVAYFVRGRKLLEGYIKDHGIYCHHCNCVVAPSAFEAHAGKASRRKPYHNIYTSNGVSLHELSVSLSKGRKKSASENDDLCSICADGGDLLLCDLCPRAFHPECVGLSSIPEGDYECRYCQLMHEREKNVAYNDNAIAAGRVAGVDPIEQIIQRCIRIMKTSNDISSCVLCKCHDFSRSSFDDRTVIICDQCEKEYHIGCLRNNNMCDLKELPEGKWFCNSSCSTIHATLQKLLFKPCSLQSAHVDIIKKRHKKNGLNYDGRKDVSWRLISGKLSHAGTKLLLSEAITIFHESFSPIVDAAGLDLIPSFVYGREVGDQDYGGMYCAVLTVNSSVVSAGILRILGSVAELPLVATRKDCQGLGYFQSLFSCIEELLVSLKVKHFVLPSADESEAIWVQKFGFTKITPEHLQEYARGAHLMIFHSTSWLYKSVPVPSG